MNYNLLFVLVVLIERNECYERLKKIDLISVQVNLGV